MTLISKFGARC